MKILAVIPARYASGRFPGKPLIDLKGKTMIRRVYEGVQKSSQFYKIIVATDDQRIFDEVKSFGGDVIMTSASHQTGTDRCGEVLSHYPEADLVVNIQGDEPLVDYRQIDQLLSAFEIESTGIATLGIRDISMEDLINPNRIKIVLDSESNALYFSRSAIPNFHNFPESPLDSYPFLRHIGLYAFRSSVLKQLVALSPGALEKIESLEQLRWLYYGYKIRVVETDIETPNIDVPGDLEKVLSLL